MKTSVPSFRRVVWHTAFSFVCVSAMSIFTSAASPVGDGSGDPDAGTLTLNTATLSQGSSATASGGATGSLAINTYTSGGALINGKLLQTGTTAEPVMPALSGSVSDLKFKMNTERGVTRVRATVSLTNSLDKTLHNVTATVYVSDDGTLGADDVQIFTLRLSDYFPKAKIRRHSTLSLPLKRKVPTILASYLEGKYLIVDLGATGLTGTDTQPIVIGPITLP